MGKWKSKEIGIMYFESERSLMDNDFMMTKSSYEGIADGDLVKMTRMGDNEAESILLDRYKKIVKQRSSSFFMPGADREDLIQEGMVGVFKAIRDYDPAKGASFSTFVEMCIRRQLISAVKSAARMKHSPLNDSLSLNKPVTEDTERIATLEEILADDGSSDPEKILLMQENLDYIEKYSGEIFTQLEWDVWRMYANGSSYKEIAERLDKTNKAVDNAIRRAKKKLAEIIE